MSSRAICRPLPYPMRLGRKPIAIATTASTVTTRMAAASISTSFSVAQSPRWLGALAPSVHLPAVLPPSKPCAGCCGRGSGFGATNFGLVQKVGRAAKVGSLLRHQMPQKSGSAATEPQHVVDVPEAASPRLLTSETASGVGRCVFRLTPGRSSTTPDERSVMCKGGKRSTGQLALPGVAT